MLVNASFFTLRLVSGFDTGVYMLRDSYIAIRQKMIAANVSGAAIASEKGWSRSYVSHVITGRSKNREVRAAIASKLGCAVTDLWST